MPTFTDFTLATPLLQRLQELNYTKPTPIQEQTIPLILTGKDVVGQAETGSGKTAAYGLPILQQIQVPLGQVQALIIVPTRELALQVRDELKKLAKYIDNLKILAVYGGHSFAEEESSFTHLPHILIATPGRLVDHLNRDTLDLHAIHQLVIDEADKLLHMKFEEELNQILEQLPQKRQSLLFSATLPEAVKGLISKSLKNPQFIITDENANPEQIEFTAYKVEASAKLAFLWKLLVVLNQPRAIIFCNTRERVAEVGTFLRKKGVSVDCLHGAMKQVDRDKSLLKFKNESIQLLVATDLAARGIHIAGLETVIHVEIVREESSFLHRSGRTGRAGGTGNVYALLSPEEEEYIKKWSQIKELHWQTLEQANADSTKEIAVPSTPEYITLHIKAGKKEKVSPRDIVGAIVAETSLSANQIGKIEVHDHFSYVAVPLNEGKLTAEKLNAGKIKGRKIRVTVVK